MAGGIVTTARAIGIAQLCDAMRREFSEQPGLRLTRLQAQRLFGTTPLLCQRALDALISEGLLIKTSDDQYCRPGFDITFVDGDE
jgi:hypothetical protein